MTTDAVLQPVTAGDQGHRLAGRLGPTAIVFMVVAAAAPLTVVAGTFPIGIAAGNGAAYPASYVVCTAVLLLFAVGFTAMARHIRGAGAFYTYIAHGFGRHVGLGAAFLALLSYTAVQGGVYGYIGAALDGIVTSHGGPSVPWYLYALVMLAVVGTLGYRHIELSGKVLGVLLVCEVGIVLVINLAVVGRGGAEGLSTAVLHPGNFFAGAPGIALIFALAGYIGFEATAVFRDEARDPARTIPRATYVALLLIGGFYTFSSWAMVSAWGDEGAVLKSAEDPEGILPETAVRYVGAVTGDLVQIFLITSLFAALLSFHNVLARYIFSLGNTRALPRRCGRSHARHSSPHIASVVQTISALVLILAAVVTHLDPVTQVFAWFVGTASVGIVLLMTITSAAVVVYFRRHRVDPRPWNTLVAPTLGFLGLAALSVLTAANLPLLVGGSTTLAGVIGVLLAGTFLGGVTLAVLRPHIAHPTPHEDRENTENPVITKEIKK
ncbi:APC family permease [Mycolicibacterium smegmatis]|uniref:Amino acid permease-associated region n=1 Tax=Mycolicibacterium smegmatis (strain MKD8) TaxID=1214915 RepID=A0A2U9PXM4_MYCSE|nr:APC family permease [Mycolicibacterium smegmatis]AWT56484.1 amino acid permease-associated region [Mycolicibacterium smegmatis MKD8]MCP2621926.1 APC family permease [Mycolicibacterium smegmatis]UGU34469.1 APC family permease [Mycolicibacterium smegmatis]ULN34424.1 APC family permease [Mycolicibacterium smegmatis]ULN69298.1 APC family permease [Mycolicibacterium smegmatis]